MAQRGIMSGPLIGPDGVAAPEARAAQVRALAGLIVSDIGVNLQAGQLLGVTAEPGMELIWRAVAEAAYARGAKFVDTWLFDPFVKHARLAQAPLDSLEYVPPWWGGRYLAMGEMAAAQVRLTGSVAPTLMDDIASERLGADLMPRLRETLQVTHSGAWNWIVTPGPSAGWASALYPDLPAADALDRLWQQIAVVMRLDEPDPAAAWRARFSVLKGVAERLTSAHFESLHFEGPGTDLTVGLLPGSVFKEAGSDRTAAGIGFTANLPTEEVFSAPDPRRVEGIVAATKPLVVGGGVVRDLIVRFEAGRAVSVSASAGAGLVETMIARDEGAARLGEVALVDGDSRIGRLGTVFYDTLLDENSASHVALGAAYPDTVDSDESRALINDSSIHTDFMIGSPEVAVTGVAADGTRVPVLRGGAWQL